MSRQHRNQLLKNVQDKERHRIVVENDPNAAVPPSGLDGHWNVSSIPTAPAKPTEETGDATKKKTNSRKAEPYEYVPASPGHPDGEIMDPRVWSDNSPANPEEHADDDSSQMEINQYDREQDSLNLKIQRYVAPGAEEVAANPEKYTGHAELRLETAAPGYEIERIKGYPSQEAIKDFMSPKGRKIRMPDPEMKKTSTGLRVPRIFYENCDPKLFDLFEKDPVEFEPYSHNQVQSKSPGAYVMVSKGTLYAIGKDGMLPSLRFLDPKRQLTRSDGCL